MNMMDERFEVWIEELLRRNNVDTISALTDMMIDEEIQETESSIKNEELWELGSDGQARACHRVNALNMCEYIDFLEELKESAGPEMHTISLVLGIYDDPDELPLKVSFHIPTHIDKAALRKSLVAARKNVCQNDEDFCVENAFEEILRETCSSIGSGSTYCRTRLKSLHEKENLWVMQT